MARRVSWTNNSSGHTGTYVYRAPTLDPQNLPAPVATVDPVAQGATAEWIDNESLADGTYDYATQDFDGSGTGALSAVVSYTIDTSTDFSTVSIGDEVEGGIYAGVITYADSRQFHLIAAKQSGESAGLAWGNYNVNTTADDLDDGVFNQNEILTNYDNGSADAFYHCRDYAGGGMNDWYLPAKNELTFVYDNLVAASHPEFSTNLSAYRRASNELQTSPLLYAGSIRFSDGLYGSGGTKTSLNPVRPVRRVAI